MIKKLSEIGGFLAFLAIMFVAGMFFVNYFADTLTLTSYSSGQTGAQILSTQNANNAAITNIVNGKLTKGNFKAAPQTSDKLTIAQLNLASSITSAMLDPNSAFISASATTGVVSGFGVLQAKAQATPGPTLQVGAGVYVANGLPVVYAGGPSPAISAPSANPRISTLAIDANGTLAWQNGDAVASPAEPILNPGLMSIVQVYCPATKSSIYNLNNGVDCYVYRDARPLLVNYGLPINDPSLGAYFADHFLWGNATGAGLNAEWGTHSSCVLSTDGTAKCSGSVANTELAFVGGAGSDGNYRHLQIQIDRGGTYIARFRFKIVTEPVTRYQFGLASATTPDLSAGYTADHVAIVKGASATQFKCQTRVGAGTATVSSDITFDNTIWNVMEIRVNSTTAEFFLNNKSVYSTALTIPSAVIMFPRFLGRDAASGPEDYRLDYYIQAMVQPTLAS